MKKITITILILIISLNLPAQTYFGVGATTNAMALEIGHNRFGLDFKCRRDFSLTNTPIGDTRKTYSLSVGKRFTIWAKGNEDDNENFDWSFTPFIGWCYGYEITDLPIKKEGEYNYYKNKYSKPYFNFEVQRAVNNMHRIKLIAGVIYSNKLLPYTGFKFYLKENR